MNELEWRAVLDYADYEVSDTGHVRRVTPGRGARAGHVLQPWISPRGYRLVAIRREGATVTRLICQLVCEAFHGPRADGVEVRHLNGIAGDDAAANLAWGTHYDNMQDVKRHGTHWNTTKTHCKNGHPFSDENTVPRAEGGRRCLTCQRQSNQKSKARRRQLSVGAR